MINDKQTIDLAVNAIMLATIDIGMSYYKTKEPVGPAEIAGPAGTTSVVCPGKGKDFAPGETSRVWGEIPLETKNNALVLFYFLN